LIVSHAEFTSSGGIREDFFTAYCSEKEYFAEEAEALFAAYESELAQYGCSQDSEMLLRIHLSDVTNQFEILKTILKDRRSFVSIVGQPPVDNRRIAIEAWHWQGAEKRVNGDALEMNLNNYQALWFKKENLRSAGSFDQTYEEFEALGDYLEKHNANVAGNTVRTWLYNRDVDNNYVGLVQARNKYFAGIGLTEDTHFIASTGIEGQMADVKRLVKMDSINYPGLQPGQMQYLYALENLSPTAIYGVSFERGTRLIFGDRSHYFISGTASIDKHGEVMYLCDVAKQTHRIMDNIEALLAEGGGSLSNIKLGTLYLRDTADADIARNIIFERIGKTLPLVTVKAPVCRPAWLVEMECIAVNDKGSDKYPVLK